MTVQAGSRNLEGHLAWNIKARFREYVRSLPDGKEAWLGGAGTMDADTIRFQLEDATDFNTGTFQGVLRFSGRLRFSGYRGALRVDIADPWLEVHGNDIHVTANIAPAGLESNRVEIATTKAPTDGADTLRWQKLATSLTEEGTALLGNHYTEADALSVMFVSKN